MLYLRGQAHGLHMPPLRLLCVIEYDKVGGIALLGAGDDDGIFCIGAQADLAFVHQLEVDAGSSGLGRRIGKVWRRDAQLRCQQAPLRRISAAQGTGNGIGRMCLKFLVFLLQERNLSRQDGYEIDDKNKRAENFHSTTQTRCRFR